MHPSRTEYKIVRPGGAFNKLYALAKRLGEPLATGTLNWPTVAAERDGKVIGFLSTLPVDGAVVAGPLILEKPSAITAMRLAEAYEVVLRLGGVKTYLHTVEKARTGYIEMLERAGFRKYNENDTLVAMRRDL